MPQTPAPCEVYPACEQCVFSAFLDAVDGFAAGVTAEAGLLGDLLVQSPDADRRRTDDVWSPLEYACHVRDVLLVQRERVLLARRTPRPELEPMGREERAEHDGYALQDPRRVRRQLLDAADMFGNVLARLAAEDWDRTVVYNYPNRAERSLRWVAAHTLHEVRHHLGDVRAQLASSW